MTAQQAQIFYWFSMACMWLTIWLSSIIYYQYSKSLKWAIKEGEKALEISRTYTKLISLQFPDFIPKPSLVPDPIDDKEIPQ